MHKMNMIENSPLNQNVIYPAYMAQDFNSEFEIWEKDLKVNCHIAVQCHIFYVDLLDEIKEKLDNIPYAYDLYITTDDEEKAQYINKNLSGNTKALHVEIQVMPNKGRDVIPFLQQMKPVLGNYDYICHLHTKKSLKAPQLGIIWRQASYNALLGSVRQIRQLFTVFHKEIKTGLLFPHIAEYITIPLDWAAEKPWAEILWKRMKFTSVLPNDIVFPAGSMMWMRVKAVEQLLNLPITPDDVPPEEDQTKETIMHAIERLWVYVAKENGYDFRQIGTKKQDAKSIELVNKKEGPANYFAWVLFRKIKYIINCLSFDREYYLNKYPDVARSGMNPFSHYKKHGWREGRYCSLNDEIEDKMDKRAYLKRYSDVAKTGMDPVMHYLRHGRYEGRVLLSRMNSNNDISNRCNSYADDIRNLHLSDTAKIIAVVVHDFSRTGCPINGWNIVKALKKKYNVIVLSLGDGPLKENFAKIADTVILVPHNIKNNPNKISEFLEKRIGFLSFYFCLANSIETSKALPYFAEKKVPSILLVHEFAQCTSDELLKMGFCYATQVVYSSQTVLNATLKKLGIDCKVPILPQGVSEIPNVKDKVLNQHEKDLFSQLEQFKHEENGKIIIAVGVVDYRKGVDLFIKTAAKIKELYKEQKIKFLWIGECFDTGNNMYFNLQNDQVVECGLQDDFIFTGQTAQMNKYYEMADLLLMTSILDPLPGVVIEAMVNKIPVVCFERCSGFPEYFEKFGLDICIARYLSTSDMAKKAAKLLKDENLYSCVSSKLYDLAKERFDMDSYTNSIMNMMPDVIKTNEEDIANVGQTNHSDFLPLLKAYRVRKLGLMDRENRTSGVQQS